jgi:glycosyltransferase involved in cell wall biosynthesis
MSGGSEKQALLLAIVLKERYDVTILVYYGKKIEKKFKDVIMHNDIKLIRFTGNVLEKLWCIYWFFVRTKFDIIFCYLLLPNLIGGVLGKLAGIRYTIGGIRSSHFDSNKIFLNRILQNRINNYTIYNNYHGVQNFSRMNFNVSKAYVISNCIDQKKDYIKRTNRRVLTILSVGRFHEAKDYRTALQSIKIVSSNYNVRYRLIGWGKKEIDIRSWITSFNLEDKAEIIVNPKDLDKYYREADIFLQTSIFEGLSNTIMEAMNYSLPIVATHVGDNKLLVEDCGSGILCRAGDSQEIAKSLCSLCKDNNLRNSMGLKGYEHIKKNYSISNFKNKYIYFIENLNE